MSKSARAPTMPIGRQGYPHFPGGHLAGHETDERPIQIALVADESISAHQALGGLPMIWERTVIVWRCTNEDVPREARSGRLDCIVFCEADEDGALRLHHSRSQVQSADRA